MTKLEGFVNSIMNTLSLLFNSSLRPRKRYVVTSGNGFTTAATGDEETYAVYFIDATTIDDITMPNTVNSAALAGDVDAGIVYYGKITELTVTSGRAIIYSNKLT